MPANPVRGMVLGEAANSAQELTTDSMAEGNLPEVGANRPFSTEEEPLQHITPSNILGAFLLPLFDLSEIV